MLGMGLVFQMPAVNYVLARIGLVTASFLIVSGRLPHRDPDCRRLLSPTSDIPNMMLFAAPMIVCIRLDFRRLESVASRATVLRPDEPEGVCLQAFSWRFKATSPA